MILLCYELLGNYPRKKRISEQTWVLVFLFSSFPSKLSSFNSTRVWNPNMFMISERVPLLCQSSKNYSFESYEGVSFAC